MNDGGVHEDSERRGGPTLLERLGAWPWAPFVAASPGWTSYTLAHRDTPRLLSENLNPAPATACLHMFAGALIVLALWAWLVPRLQRERPAHAPTKAAAWSEAVLSTRWLLLGPIVLTLLHDSAGFAGLGRPVLVFVGALLVALSVRRLPLRAPTWLPSLRRLAGGERWPLSALLVGVGVIAMLLLRLALQRHHGFETRAFDLGIYDNLVWNTAHGDFLRCTLIKGGVHTAAHFDPILALFGLPYRLAPRAETLVILQSLWVLSGLIPAYRIAMRRLDDRAAATIFALGFALYPSVHGAIVFDFHSLALLAAPGLWMIDCLDRDLPLGYWLSFALALTIREDASLFLAGIGAYTLLATEHRRRGAATIGLALAYLAFVKFAVMPDADLLMRNSDTNYTYANRYRRLIPKQGSTRDGLATLLTNPSFVFGHVLTSTKLASLAALLVPLGLLPLLSGRRLLLAVYGAAFMFLASHKSIFYPLFHYATVLYPVLFAAAPEGLARLREWLIARDTTPATRAAHAARVRVTVLAYLGTSLLLGSLSMGALFGVAAFDDSRKLVREFDAERRAYYQAFRGAVEQIPGDASVTATNRPAPHLSNRAELYIVQQRVEAEWMVVDLEDIKGTEDAAWVFQLIREGSYEKSSEVGERLMVLRRVSEP